jgi:uncharacterized DUF497 family protein
VPVSSDVRPAPVRGLRYAYDIYIIGWMPLEHDPVKAAANLKKHGVSFADAEGALLDPLALTIEDIGAAGAARRATRKERKAYET